MSEITLRYTLTLDDLVNFSEVAMKKKTVSMRILCLVLTCVWAFFFVAFKEYGIMAFAVVFLLIGAFYPYVLKYTAKKSYAKSFMLKKETQLEFYNDHLVEKILPNSESGYESEMHIPFEKIINITETDGLFLFFITPIEAIGAPKSAFTEQDREKLFNLIENVFSTRFTQISSFKSYKNDKSNNGKRG